MAGEEVETGGKEGPRGRSRAAGVVEELAWRDGTSEALGELQFAPTFVTYNRGQHCAMQRHQARGQER